MTAESPDTASERETRAIEHVPSSDDEGSEDQRTIRERVIRLAFGGDPRRYDEFVRVLDEATPAGVEVILRGSAVTGHKWKTDEPFDADGPGTSDLDVTFVGGDMVTLFREFHIPEIHSARSARRIRSRRRRSARCGSGSAR